MYEPPSFESFSKNTGPFDCAVSRVYYSKIRYQPAADLTIRLRIYPISSLDE